MTTHSPAPWTNRHFDDFGAIRIDANSQMMARVYPRTLDAYGTVNDETITECEANARLIAAAPELLAACETAERALLAMRPFYSDQQATPAAMALQQIRAAVAAAQGVAR